MLLRSRILGAGAVAASASVLAIGVVACGSDGESDTAGTTPANATSTQESTTSAAAAAPTPDPAELQGELALLVDPGRPVLDKTAVLADGERRAANLDTVTKALANYGQITFTVGNVAVLGDTATATVDIASPHGTVPTPMTWQNVDGTWKLSDASACQLFAMGGAPCA